MSVAQGETVTIKARGALNWYTGGCPSSSACIVSTPAGANCNFSGYAAPGLPCWSLIGKLGANGAPFEVGESSTFVAPVSGELFLGVNDDNFADNSGRWIATIVATPSYAATSALALPEVMRFCDVNCSTLHLQPGSGGSYVSENGNDHWTIQSFTQESATFHRRVDNPAFELTYRGRVSEDGNSLVDVANPFCCNGGQPANIMLN